MKLKGLLVLIFIIINQNIVFAQKEDLRQAYADSIKTSTWAYRLPAWGQRITKRGVDLPYPIGIMINYFSGSQKVVISDLEVGINNSPLVPLDFVKFGETKATLNSVTSRIDVWALPFVDIYAVVGKTWASTSVNVVEPMNFSNKVDFEGGTFGVGMTLGGAYKHVFGTLDYNNTWTKFDQIEGSIHSQMLAPRFGYVFQSRRKPNRNFAPWIGVQGLFVNRVTKGTINLSDLGVSGNSADFDVEDKTWYQNLPAADKVIIKQIADKIRDKLDKLDPEDASISYSLKKKALSPWSMSVGGQFQLDHHWQFRTEAGFFGGRSSILASVNYRFGF